MDKLKIGDQIFYVDYCKKNFKKEERVANPIRSNSQELQDERGVNNGTRGERRSRSQSPGRRSWSQREQTVESAQRSNEQMVQTEESVASSSQQEVRFRVGGRTRVNDPREKGKYREEMLQTLSSENGSITRINRMNSGPQYYNLSNWMTKKI